MQILGALQFGLSGLAAILFVITVRILQTEQKRQVIRPEVLNTLKIVMAFAVFLVLVPAGLEVFRKVSDTSTGNYKTAVREQVKALSDIEDLRVMYLLGHDFPEGQAKTQLIQFVSKICAATSELQKTTGERHDPEQCKRIEEALKNTQ